MSTELPRPLPECRLCQTPTRRRTHQRTGGLCSACYKRYERERAVQTQLLLPLDKPDDQPADLSNVVLFRPRGAKQ
jgi:hypothetical protein